MPSSEKRVLICQNRSCRKLGSDRVLAAFQCEAIEGVRVEASGCLGQCGNGPMILVEPEEVWYWQVRPSEVPAIIDRHLRGGKPVKGILYPKFHRV
nr:(2Fe-2S) ferredoxin domain-containing protein [Oscillatoria sp. FACHB-1406]